MGAQNNFRGKYQEGTFANGEGPISGIEIKRESETSGQLNPATSGRNVKSVGGQGDGLQGRSEEKGFDIHGASYKGPQNMTPKDMGEVPNQP